MIKEYILCAATHYDDEKKHVHQPKNIKTGVVVAGRRHHNCIATANILNKELAQTCKKGSIQGFLTNTDRFVDRFEAYQIAEKAKQLLTKSKATVPMLLSEDVW